jgi:hypothetical protein
VDELPSVFDLAIPQWCQYFEVDERSLDDWQMVASIMQDPVRFRRAGLLPDGLPPFEHGYQLRAQMWVHQQPSDYYRRHLLLHEGTHAFMKWVLGGAGPPWYMEGTAELLATHSWRAGQLDLRHFPMSKEDTPHWGRIKIIRDDLKAGEGKSISQVLQYGEEAHLNVEPYAWCWAAASFFETHPLCRESFHQLRLHARELDTGFSQRFRESLAPHWSALERQWQVFVFGLDYGFQFDREVIQPRLAQPLPAAGATVEVVADRGWQSSGYRLQQGVRYRITATGRFQVADTPRVWWCEPNGVTIRCHRGQPLGILLGAVVDEGQPPQGLTPLVQPDVIGQQLENEVDRSGTLYLRINESGRELADNAGKLLVRVEPVEPRR